MTSNYQTATHDASGTAQKWHILTILGHPRTPCNNTFFVKNRHRFFENSLIHIFGPGFESKLDPQNIYFLFFLKIKNVHRFCDFHQFWRHSLERRSLGPKDQTFDISLSNFVQFFGFWSILINFRPFLTKFWPFFDQKQTQKWGKLALFKVPGGTFKKTWTGFIFWLGPQKLTTKTDQISTKNADF